MRCDWQFDWLPLQSLLPLVQHIPVYQEFFKGNRQTL
jgi:hypothetical protein